MTSSGIPRGRAADAKDLAADVLATAWRRREGVPEGAELPWLYKTTGFVLANHRRKLRALPVAAVPEEPDDVAPETLTLADDGVRQVLARLTPRDRRICSSSPGTACPATSSRRCWASRAAG